jgi:ribosome-associated toxin RatA of RatAB toxin-antitoxin module
MEEKGARGEKVMRCVEASIVIRAAQEALFDLSQDYALRTAWDPFTRELHFLDGQKPAPGGRVLTRAYNGLSMTVEYVSYNRPGVVAMRMIDGPSLFRLFAGSWRFVPRQTSETEVIFRYVFETRPSWLRWLIEPVVAWVFRRDLKARLRGLKRGAEEMGLLDRLGAGYG